MRQTNSFSPIKRSMIRINHNNRRNVKSLKRLGHHLENYQNNQEQKMTNLSLTKSNAGRSLSQWPQSKENDNNLNIPSSIKLTMDNNLDKKISLLLDNILLNISIFQKVFASSIRKKQIIEKLYGWDPVFQSAFFPKNQNNFKTKLNKQCMILQLNLDKNTFGARNIYNKLRFFLAQLVDLNFKQQESQCLFRRQRITLSSHKLLNKLQLVHKQTGKSSTKTEIKDMRETHYDLFNKKVKIKNRGRQLQKILGTSGNNRLHPFFLREQKNIEEIQSFLKYSLIK